MTVMEEANYFTLISGGKIARDHLSICSKYVAKPEKNRDRKWGQKAQTKTWKYREVKLNVLHLNSL